MNGKPSLFLQAEDGIRGLYVTGVQTCALPFWDRRRRDEPRAALRVRVRGVLRERDAQQRPPTGPRGRRGRRDGDLGRSEERRGGKEGRSGWEREKCRRKIGRRITIPLTISNRE